MTATVEPLAPAADQAAGARPARAEGLELLGSVHGCGYRDGAFLARRADGQMVQLGQLMYALLECIDGRRDARQLADAMSQSLGRRVRPEHVGRLAEKLAEQGLLSGTEHRAPPKRNPLLALRWKVLVTDPTLTRRLTAPFMFLFRPWVMWPVLLGFAVVFWFVLIHKGVASATVQAFHRPELLLLVFALAVVSAGLHELGHAAACRYGGATPGGMGMGLYLVWPAFYTDVTDTYRLPKRARLRVDLAGLYFNAVVAVVTLGVWLVWRADALLLLVALQVLQMVKQLSPVIRADGYHILSDATGVPDLFSHMGPTLRRLLPSHRQEPSALSGRARALVTIWVLIMVPVLLSLTLGAILVLPHLAASAWDSGRHIVNAVPHQVGRGQVIKLLASLVRLLALALPAAGSVLVIQKVLRTTSARARVWSAGRAGRQVVVVAAALAALGGVAWAWWPSGQYQAVRPGARGTIGGLLHLVSAPGPAVRPAPAPTAARVSIAPGQHLAVSMIPVGGASRRHPALFVIAGGQGRAPVAIVSPTASLPVTGTAGTSPGQGSPVGSGSSSGASGLPNGASGAPAAGPGSGAGGASGTAGASSGAPASPGSGGAASPGAGSASSGSTPSPAGAAGSGGAGSGSSTATGSLRQLVTATAFPFKLPSGARPGDSQALAVNTRNGGVLYDVAYSLVTVTGGSAVNERNSAFAYAHCTGCTTVAVSVQVVLIVGQSHVIAPINEAGALNANCPACTTTALADQIVVTLKSQPTRALLSQLQADLQQLGALPALGAGGTPAAVAAEVAAVQTQIDSQLAASGLLTNPPTATSATSATTTATTPTTPASTSATTTTTTATGTAGPSTGLTTTSPAQSTTPTPGTSSTTSTTPATTSATTTSPTATTTSSSSGSTGVPSGSGASGPASSASG